MTERYGYSFINITGGEHFILPIDQPIKGNLLSSRVLDNILPLGLDIFFGARQDSVLNASLALTVAKRPVHDIHDWGEEIYWLEWAHWTEGEAILLPPKSVGSLLVSRRFISMPGSDTAILSIDQITNPYPVPIQVETGIDLKGFDFKHRELNGMILDHVTPEMSTIRRGYLVFGASTGDQDQPIRVPAFSCRSVVHLWNIFPQDMDDYLSKGIDLINRFSVLDFKSIVLKEKACSLPEQE